MRRPSREYLTTTLCVIERGEPVAPSVDLLNASGLLKRAEPGVCASLGVCTERTA
jgi:hypothetical protein